jgi:isocitrate dehydrogenase (NAD+)
MAAHQVVLIPGDGIGPEVTAVVCRVLAAAGAPVEWVERYAGLAAMEKRNELLPADTLDAIQQQGVALKGPCTTPIGEGFSSVNVQLRKRLNLYAAVRPVRNLAGVPARQMTRDLGGSLNTTEFTEAIIRRL